MHDTGWRRYERELRDSNGCVAPPPDARKPQEGSKECVI
jgi:hypothetical protein